MREKLISLFCVGFSCNRPVDIVYGSMSCHTTINGISGYSDSHPDIPSDYLLHSSVRIDRGRWHGLRSRCDFKVLTNTGMQPGNVMNFVDFIAR